MKGTRMICNIELSDKLRDLERTGVNVPFLMSSNYMPEYIKNEGDVEVYQHEGRLLKVKPSQVIDSHGNVVNLRELEAKRNLALTDLSGLNKRQKYE